MQVTAILAAAGSGVRLGADLPKALVPVNRKPLFLIAADALVKSGIVSQIVITAPEEYVAEFRLLAARLPLPTQVVSGADTRQGSVTAALAVVNPAAEVLLVHDAARPFASPELIKQVAEAVVAGAKAVIPALPVTDTIKQVAPLSPSSRAQQPSFRAGSNSSFHAESGNLAPSNNDVSNPSGHCGRDSQSAPSITTTSQVFVQKTLDRETLMAVQTPQGFDRSTLVHAYAQAAKQGLEVTDDAALLEALGVPVLVIPGEPLAFKITTPTDLLLAETLLTPKSKPTEASPSLRAPRSNPDAVER